MGSIFGAIIVCCIIGLPIYYCLLHYIFKKECGHMTKKDVDRLLGLPFIHLMLACIIYATTQNMLPETSTDSIIKPFSQFPLIGFLVEAFTGVDVYANTEISNEVEIFQERATIFVVLSILMALFEWVAVIGRKIHCWIIEGVVIINSLGIISFLYYSQKVQTSIMESSAVFQLAEWFGGFLSNCCSWLMSVFWIVIIGMVVNYIFYHNALRKYYRQ